MFKKIRSGDAPKRERKSESKFEKTPDWLAMRREIDRGLRPGHDLQVQLSEKELAEYGITNHRTVARFIKKYLADKGLTYKVDSLQRGGYHFTIVRGPKQDA